MVFEEVAIYEILAELEGQSVPCHWECDTASDSHNSHVATLVEGQLQFTLLVEAPCTGTSIMVSEIKRSNISKIWAKLITGSYAWRSRTTGS